MSHLLYLACLITALACMALIDYRAKLAFWNNRRAACFTLAASMLIFIVWDILGISLGIFFNGHSRYMLPFELFPDFPLEELFFLDYW